MTFLSEKNTIPYIENGLILNVDKPKGITSFGAVNRLKTWTGYHKAGHAGTLDPMATGVLIVCLGRATKQVRHLMEMEKVYRGCIELGLTTDTDDAEGSVLVRSKVENFSTKQVSDALDKFRGTIQQIPPMYSAVKRKGKRLYQLARKGIEVSRPPRLVDIYDIRLLDWEIPHLTIEVRCSKGTYIRSIARDIGIDLKTGGCLKSLRRIRVGPYKAEDAFTMEDLKSKFLINENLFL